MEVDRQVTAYGDRELVRRVIGNLVGNAFKFAPTRGHVTIRISKVDNQARVAVTDDGEGIDPRYHAKIFEKFGQLEEGQKKIGTGMGLTFAKMAIEAHGGTIGLSSAPGKGSTFWFTLPASAPSAAPAQQP